MVALRSRRLESLFGTRLDVLQSAHILGLVTIGAQEAFDLEFKEELYGGGDSDKRALAGDVAALANTAGGVIVLGVQEDGQARAVAAPGVAVAEAEVNRIRHVVASLVAPMPEIDVLAIPSSTADGGSAGQAPAASPASHGFIVIAVARSPAAPHAVLVNAGLRYPRRNGATIRYLSEPEVAVAYRDRLAGAQRQSVRIEDVERDALSRLDISDLPWVVVSLVPDLPGELSIGSQAFASFERETIGQCPTIVPTGVNMRRARVGRRRLLADGTMNDSPLARWISTELHTDGAGTFAVCVPNLALNRTASAQDSGTQSQIINDENIAIAVLSGLLYLARHAQDRAAAGGNALIRAQICPISPERPTALGHTRFHGIPEQRGTQALISPAPAAEAAAALDDLGQPGAGLTAASALLVNEIGQMFGIAEMGQISLDGQLRRPYWSNTQILTWAESHGIEVTDERLT